MGAEIEHSKKGQYLQMADYLAWSAYRPMSRRLALVKLSQLLRIRSINCIGIGPPVPGTGFFVVSLYLRRIRYSVALQTLRETC